MSSTTKLRFARDDKAVKFLEFIRLYSKDSQQVCCFFEGDDAKYYCVRIHAILPNHSWSPINCRGKRQVLELYALISNHADYAKARTSFFVDRDFDPPLPSEVRKRVYETPCYSIENLYTTVDCFRRVLQSEFGITDGVHDGTALEKCCELFQKTHQSFHEAITELNAWIWLQRNNNINTASALNLRGVKLDRFVGVSLGAITKRYTVAELKDVFPQAPAVDENTLVSKIVEFQSSDRRRLFRGKYEIEFLRLMLTKLMEDFRSAEPRFFPRQGKVKCTLSRENIISELSQYADTPECLREYLLSLN